MKRVPLVLWLVLLFAAVDPLLLRLVPPPTVPPAGAPRAGRWFVDRWNRTWIWNPGLYLGIHRAFARPPRRAGEEVVAFYGDSNMLDFDVPTEATLPAVIERALRNADVRARCENFGMAVPVVTEHVAVLRRTLPVAMPSRVIWLLDPGNLENKPWISPPADDAEARARVARLCDWDGSEPLPRGYGLDDPRWTGTHQDAVYAKISWSYAMNPVARWASAVAADRTLGARNLPNWYGETSRRPKGDPFFDRPPARIPLDRLRPNPQYDAVGIFAREVAAAGAKLWIVVPPMIPDLFIERPDEALPIFRAEVARQVDGIPNVRILDHANFLRREEMTDWIHRRENGNARYGAHLASLLRADAAAAGGGGAPQQ